MSQNPQENIPRQEPLDDPAANHVGLDSSLEHEKVRAATFEIKKPSWFARLMRGLLGTDTRSGRFLRLLIRIAALSVVFFALGVLAAYWRLYVPLRDQSGLLVQNYETIQVELLNTRQDLMTATNQASEAETRASLATSRLKVEQTHNHLLQALLKLAEARQALQENQKISARQAIENAEQHVMSIESQITALDAQQGQSIEALFALIYSDLQRESRIVLQDLDRLQKELEMVERDLLMTNQTHWQCQCTLPQP